MSISTLYRWVIGVAIAIVASALVAGLVVFLVRKDVDNNGSADTAGYRVTDTLKFLVFISRHGNRGASADYTSDPYPLDDPQYWPYGIDRLTPQGRVQMYNLGVRVRALYDGFLNSTFHPEEIHASSTYKDRMLLSGESFLAGLYPPKGWQLWDSGIAWQPTPLYSDSPDKTIIINDCAKYLENYLVEGEEFLETYAANLSSLINSYNNLTGCNSTGFDGVNNLWIFWDKVISEDTEGYTIPDWANELYPEPLGSLMAQEYVTTFAANTEIIRLLVGELLDEILGVLQGVVNGTETERKVQYYSGHDSTLVALQVLMGVSMDSTTSLVRAGSGMALELHQNQNTSQYYLDLVYIDGGTTDLDLTVLSSPTCRYPCDYNTFLNITLPYTDVNYEEECKTTSSLHSTQRSSFIRSLRLL